MVRRSLGTGDKAEARRRLRAYGSKPGSETMSRRIKSPTWDEAATALLRYYADYGTRRVDEAEKVVKTLTRYFAGRSLEDITTAEVQRYVSHERSKGLSAASVNLRLNTLRKALRLAYEREELARLPIIRTLRPDAPRAGFFEPWEFEAVAAQLPPDLELVARLAYTLGWRIDSELLPLQWPQVDLAEGTIRIPPGGSKNRDGRLIYLTPTLRDGLAAQRARVLTMERELGKIIPYVFPQTYGHRRGKQRRNIRRPWQKACEGAGCRGKLKHDLRRTAVSNMVQAGI
jgi:integrase